MLGANVVLVDVFKPCRSSSKVFHCLLWAILMVDTDCFSYFLRFVRKDSNRYKIILPLVLIIIRESQQRHLSVQNYSGPSLYHQKKDISSQTSGMTCIFVFILYHKKIL